MPWYQLFVKAPAGNGYTSPESMKRVDDHISSLFLFMAYFVTSTGLPLKNQDEIFEVRVYDEQLVEKAKTILTSHYGLEIVREVKNPD